MADGVFITGTGTGVGKTVITAGILRYLRSRGVDAMPMKPMQTGADTSGPRWRAPDLEAHWKATGLSVEADAYDLYCPYLFEPACSPHLAARMAGVDIDLSRILAASETLRQRHEFILYEGAGGVLVPLSETMLTTSVMRALDCPVLLVGHAALGAINHALLSVRALQAEGLHVAGIILSTPEPQPESERYILEDNPAAIECFTDVPILGVVPWLGDLEGDGAQGWEAFDEAIDWELLLKQLGLWHD